MRKKSLGTQFHVSCLGTEETQTNTYTDTQKNIGNPLTLESRGLINKVIYQLLTFSEFYLIKCIIIMSSERNLIYKL